MNRRAVLTMLRASRDWRPYAIAFALACVAGLVLGRNSTGFANVASFYGAPALAIGLIGGLLEFYQRGSVWQLVAQRPGAEANRLWSLLGSALLLYATASVLLLGCVSGGLAMNERVSPENLRAHLIHAALWTVMVGCAVALTSTLARKGTAALTVGWLFAPILLAMLHDSLGFSQAIRHAVAFALPPIDAVFGFAAVLRGEQPQDRIRFIAHLLSFPLLCLLLLHWRITILAKPDRVRSE